MVQNIQRAKELKSNFFLREKYKVFTCIILKIKNKTVT